MNTVRNESGFTLIELILVIAILGILAVAVAPQFVNIQASAQAAQRDGIAGAVRDGINMQFSNALATTGTGTFPASLDAASEGACTSANPCFTNVLQQGITAGWTKGAGNTYTHDATGTTFTYNPSTGTFQ